jgi:hypothetical protein
LLLVTLPAKEVEMTKDRNKGGREVRKPKKAKPAAKPVSPTERVPGKTVTQSSSSE